MDRPPYIPFFHSHGNRAAAFAAEGFNAGGGYSPPSFVPVGGRGYGQGQPSFAAEGGPRDYGQPFFAAERGQTSLASVDGPREYGHTSFAAVGDPRAYGQASHAAFGVPQLYSPQNPITAAAGGQHLIAAPGLAAAARGQPLFRAPCLAAGQGQPLIPASNHGVAMDADGRASHSHATGGGPFGSPFGGLFQYYGGYDTATPLALGTFQTGSFGSSRRATASPSRNLPVLSGVQVKTINRENSHDIFDRIKRSLAQRTGGLYIALDLEYAASASTDLASRPFCSSQWYSALRQFVNDGDVVQLGMVFAFQTPCPDSVQAYQVNLRIDTNSCKYNQESIDFLVENGHELDDHRDRGVLPEWAYADLIRYLPFSDESVTWITFHADRDIAFLMKLAVEGGRGMLPEDRILFMHEARRCFPVLYDVRVLAQLVIPRFAGNLKTLADNLLVKRSGEEHFAGSDALVTLGCFIKILQQCSDEGISARVGLLSGAEEFEMSVRCAVPVKYSSVYIAAVTPENFKVEGARIYEIMQCNFNIIGVQVLVPAVTSTIEVHSVSAQDSYVRMMTMLNKVDRFEVQLCFMNDEGKIAYGRVWKFIIKPGADDSLALARLLASSRATHDPRRIWVALHGAQGIACLIKSFTAPAQMPDRYTEYISCQASCFPTLVDLAIVASSSSEIPVLPTGCKGDLAHISRSLGVTSHSFDMITMLRCYMSFRDRGQLQNFVPGDLSERCCSTCTP